MLKKREQYKRKLKQLKDFLQDGIWKLDISDLGKYRAKVVKYIRIIILTVKNFVQMNLGQQAVALSFYTVMAFVPFIAVTFTISDYFNFGDYLRELIYLHFSSKEIINQVLLFANNIINSANEGIYGIISFMVFLWFVVWLMFCVDKSFNQVWKIKKTRVLWRRLLYYFITMLASPFVIIIFLMVSLTIADGIHTLGVAIPILEHINNFLVWGAFALFMIIILTVTYMAIPNTKVRFGPSLGAAVIAGLSFTAVQYLYLETQVLVSRMNAVYGVFAVVPLFMAWLNIGWLIVLVGAQLSYVFQNVDNYPLEELS